MGAPPEDAPPKDSPPEDSPPEDSPPDEVPPDEAPPEDSPPDEVPPDELEVLTGLVKREMPRAMELSVPLKVDVKVGRNWGEME